MADLDLDLDLHWAAGGKNQSIGREYVGGWWWRWQVKHGSNEELEVAAVAEEWGEGVRRKQRWW